MQTHTRRRQRQRPEGRGYKPGNAKDCQQPPAAGRGQEGSSPRNFRGSLALQTTRSERSGLQNWEKIHVSTPGSGRLFQEPRMTQRLAHTPCSNSHQPQALQATRVRVWRWPRAAQSPVWRSLTDGLSSPLAYGIGRNQESLVLCTGVHVGTVLLPPLLGERSWPRRRQAGRAAPREHTCVTAFSRISQSQRQSFWVVGPGLASCLLERLEQGGAGEPGLLLPLQGSGAAGQGGSRPQQGHHLSPTIKAEALGRAPVHPWRAAE